MIVNASIIRTVTMEKRFYLTLPDHSTAGQIKEQIRQFADLEGWRDTYRSRIDSEDIESDITCPLDEARRSVAEDFFMTDDLLGSEVLDYNGWEHYGNTSRRVFFVNNDDPEGDSISKELSVVFEKDRAIIVRATIDGEDVPSSHQFGKVEL